MSQDPLQGVFTVAFLVFAYDLCYLIPGGAGIQRVIARRLRSMT